LAPKLLCGLEALFGISVIDTYGMTEAASQIAANPLGRRKLGSVGQSAGPEVAILDDEGRCLSSGERGEIVLRGPTITRGYYNDAAATAHRNQREDYSGH
jgi:long-subunit acyl-CoA synthetase (AMP-forming)